MKKSFVWARTDKNRKKFHVNISKACGYYYKSDLRSVKLPYPLKLFIRHVFWKYLFVFVFIEVNVRGQVKRAFELNALFLQIHSSGSLWLLNAVFVITDSSRRMDWPWCSCFVKETTLGAPTLNLWLTQSYILTHARAFNIRKPRFRIGTEAPDIHIMMRFTGRCGQVLYFCGISMYPCAMGNYICK